MSSQLNLGKKKRVQYKPEAMAMAIEAVKAGMAKKAAARTYQVPKSTLLDKLTGRVPEVATKPGVKPTLTKGEEFTIVNYSKVMCEIGYPLTSKELRIEVKRILDIDGRRTPFKDNMPGRQWMSAFIRRHPEMSFRTPAGLGHERAAITNDVISGWYEGLFKYLEAEVEDHEMLTHDPRRIFNADESGFPLAVKAGRVLAPTGAIHVYQVVQSSKTQITVMACLNAYGNYVPPMILFPGERIRNVGLEGFKDALYAATKNGWMDSEAFVDFLKHLVEYAKTKEVKFPIILFVDGHSTHLSLPAAEFCRANDVILYCLLPNATHILQACDVGLFSPMKSAWHKTVKEWQMDHIGEALTKKQFPALFKTVWDKVTTMENACNGFRRAGLFPLTANGIDRSKLAPSKMVLVATTSSSACNQSTLDAEPSNIDTLNISDVAAYVEIDEEGTTSSPSVSQEVQPSADASVQLKHAKDQERNTSPSIMTDVEKVHVTPLRRDHDYVSPAFSQLSIPEPKQKKKAVQIRQKLPKALSGSKALEMLREREALKEAEQKAKEERKREREQNKIKKTQEAEEKKRQRELKKKERELKKLEASKLKKQRKRKIQNISDSESENDDTKIPYMDSDSDDVLDDVDACPKCLLVSGAPDVWITCDMCLVKWHIKCADRPEFLLLDKEGRQDMDFVCNDCL